MFFLLSLSLSLFFYRLAFTQSWIFNNSDTIHTENFISKSRKKYVYIIAVDASDLTM